MAKYIKHLRDPWLTLIKQKSKTIEGRLNKNTWAKMKSGDKIAFCNVSHACEVTIVKINKYKSFDEMLKVEEINKLTPGFNKEQCLQVYRNIYDPDEEKKIGVLAIHVQS
jgi:ASC-1-like (ASCH) protein